MRLGKGKKLYDQKWSDRKIADAMGCRVQAVLMWRKREKLASWPQSEQIKARKEEVR
ncbi:MAG: terminase gpP N-terminus-related DNA-binding protein [Dysosmobacter sp.]